MKKTLLLFVLVAFTMSAFSQMRKDEDSPKAALTVGILQGGGSLLGADLEVLLGKRFGIQGGIGLNSVGGIFKFSHERRHQEFFFCN